MPSGAQAQNFPDRIDDIAHAELLDDVRRTNSIGRLSKQSIVGSLILTIEKEWSAEARIRRTGPAVGWC